MIQSHIIKLHLIKVLCNTLFIFCFINSNIEAVKPLAFSHIFTDKTINILINSQ